VSDHSRQPHSGWSLALDQCAAALAPIADLPGNLDLCPFEFRLPLSRALQTFGTASTAEFIPADQKVAMGAADHLSPVIRQQDQFFMGTISHIPFLCSLVHLRCFTHGKDSGQEGNVVLECVNKGFQMH
jgi:hypothetical protein